MATMIPADRITRVAETRFRNLVGDAQVAVTLLRNNRIDWLAASSRIGEILANIQTVGHALEAVLDDFVAPAQQELAHVKAARLSAISELQALQDELRDTCLFNGPQRRSA